MCFRKIIAFSRQIRLCTDSEEKPPVLWRNLPKRSYLTGLGPIDLKSYGCIRASGANRPSHSRSHRLGGAARFAVL